MKKFFVIAILGLGLVGFGGYEAYEYFFGGTCNPNGSCMSCKSCKYCRHCAKNGGSCSVCRR